MISTGRQIAVYALGEPVDMRKSVLGNDIWKDLSIRCTGPILPERVIGRHRRAHEAKYGGNVGGADRGMVTKRTVSDGVCGG